MTASAPPVAVVILAAGGGSRRRSALPKPLLRVGGLSLLGHVLALAATAASSRVVVVVGEGKEAVAAEARAGMPSAVIVERPARRGTGDAVRCALPALAGFSGRVVVLYADTPFLSPGTLGALRASGAPLSVLGFDSTAPGSYGQLVLDADGALARVVEAADATDDERAISLCNAGAAALDGGATLVAPDRVLQP